MNATTRDSDTDRGIAHGVSDSAKLEALREELAKLTVWRNEVVSHAEWLIKDTNKTYDREALRLHRKIKKLTPEPEETPVTPVTRNETRRRSTPKFTLEGTEGWTQEEIDHYRELSIRNKGR